MMLLRLLPLLAALASSALADVAFTSPAAGAKIQGGGPISVAWRDSGYAPALSALTSYQLFLCAGGNDATNHIQLAAIMTQGTFAAGNVAQRTVSAGIGGSTENAYFLKMISVATQGGTITNFSPRFTLTGMTGTFPPNVIAGMATVQGTDGPPAIDAIANAPVAGGAAGAVQPAAYTVPYDLQTGLTRYAPMQQVPPTKITKKVPTPLFPTSAYTIATTPMARPTVVTTLVLSRTFSLSNRENTAAPVAQPTDDMAKFLARWED
ncbi:hypothetical protein B0A49_11990 [Cryomyces minteri]|uniref:Uncharacterized protein n=1 Tax=Cryomyces minteri TaxID=331657 RepID=A0A4U0VSA5_9PEZI|nr:hypothetical protein B0A49_11990 [Cryomyces minteri]